MTHLFIPIALLSLDREEDDGISYYKLEGKILWILRCLEKAGDTTVYLRRQKYTRNGFDSKKKVVETISERAKINHKIMILKQKSKELKSTGIKANMKYLQ